MKIKANNTIYNRLKEKVKQGLSKSKSETQAKIKEAKDYFEPKVKEGVDKAADWTDERIKDAKYAYNTAKQRIQPKVDEFIANADYALNPPKLEVLGKDVADLQKKYLQKTAYLNEFQRRFPEQTTLIYQRQKELLLLEQNVQKAVEKYNSFAAKQEAAQRAFDLLNNVK